ncbi:uncharacterized protein LOC143449413 isoform X1 [Clavelina lepadiformis]|uniref:uncharacterized protein LOC143449413 isoform X1 n=1 Tax=Clavelina lepadiformis TaxID=159417 RepID=UPI004041467C
MFIECKIIQSSGIFIAFIIFNSFVLSQNAVRNATNPSKCSKPALREGTDYCLVNNTDMNCYIEKALEFRRNATDSLPLWVQVCFFDLPQYFVDNKDRFDCEILIGGGPVNCHIKDNVTMSKLLPFQRNCTVAFFWLTTIKFPQDFYRKTILGNGKCAESYKTIWNDVDVLYAAQRYLYKPGVKFSKMSAWKPIPKSLSWMWTSTAIGLLTAGLAAICIGAALLVIFVKRKLAKYKKNVTIVLPQLNTITEFKDRHVAEPQEKVDIIEIFPEMNSSSDTDKNQ